MSSHVRRAVIYARLSKDTTKEGAGVTRQLEDGRTLAALRGFEVAGEYVDNDTSAAGQKRRPEFEAMMEAISDGGADVLIAWAWDRLSRNRRDTLRLIEVGQEQKLVVALVRGSDIDMTTASGRLVADLLAGVARAEIDAKSERQQRAGLQRAEGGWPPSRRACGYLQDGSPHPEEAPVLTALFGHFLAGATMVGLAKSLNAEGFSSTRGKPWDDTGVRVLLRNPRYIAERRYHGQRVAAGDWDPLVTADTFEAVQAKLNDKTKVRRPARRYIGGGLFRCHCGATVKISYDGQGTRVYVCTARSHMQRKAQPVEDLVYEVVSKRLRRKDAITRAASGNETVGVAELRQQALTYRARLDQLAEDYAEGLLTARQVSVATSRIERDLAAVESELATAGQSSALASIAGADDLGSAWLALPLDRQRAVLADFVDVVILPGRKGRGAFDPATVRFDWAIS